MLAGHTAVSLYQLRHVDKLWWLRQVALVSLLGGLGRFCLATSKEGGANSYL
jgi:hypothetical protein